MSKKFGKESTTSDVLAGITLENKTAVITGASAGLGIETARALASVGANVVMLGRNEEKLNAAVQQVRTALNGKGGDVSGMILILDDLDKVRENTAQILNAHPKIDLIINNAAVMACPFSKTKQGFEMQFGTNHMGHFLFTCLIMPALLKSGDARVINLSALSHRMDDIDLKDPNFETRPYEPWASYCASKTANSLFTVALDKKLKEKGVRSFAVHPGIIHTELTRHMDPESLAAISKGRNLFRKTVEQGAATSVWGATSPDLKDKGGLYLDNCGIADIVNNDQIEIDGVADYALDENRANELWHLSENFCNEQFAW